MYQSKSNFHFDTDDFNYVTCSSKATAIMLLLQKSRMFLPKRKLEWKLNPTVLEVNIKKNIFSCNQWTHPRRFAIDLTSQFHVESSSKLHRFWRANPRGNYDIDSTWKFRRGFDFQNRRNIGEFSTWIFWRCFDVEWT